MTVIIGSIYGLEVTYGHIKMSISNVLENINSRQLVINIILSYFLLICSGCQMLYGLAVDPVENKLYFSDHYNSKIEVVGVDGRGRKTFVNCTLRPTELTVDLKKRLLPAILHLQLEFII